VPYVRTVRTASGATAVQIVYSSHRRSRDIEHIGSANDEAELELLKAAARQRVVGGQVENQLPEAHRLEHDGPHGSVSAATYPQSTCRAIDLGA
jgi:hypothetical protein